MSTPTTPAPPIAVGRVVTVVLPPQPMPSQSAPGGEQLGHRPAIVVAVPHLAGAARRPLLLIIPLTSDKGYRWARANPALYPILPSGAGGLTADSVALVDQVRAVDPARVTSILRTLTPVELQPIWNGLRTLFGL